MLSFIICLVHLDDTWCIPGRAIDVHRIPSAKNVTTVFNITEGSSRFTHEFPYRHIGLTNSIFAVNTSAMFKHQVIYVIWVKGDYFLWRVVDCIWRVTYSDMVCPKGNWRIILAIIETSIRGKWEVYNSSTKTMNDSILLLLWCIGMLNLFSFTSSWIISSILPMSFIFPFDQSGRRLISLLTF